MSELHEHRVARIETGELVSRYPRTIGRNSHLGSHGEGNVSTIALVHTDQGAVGWGLVSGPIGEPGGLAGRRIDELIDPAIGVIDEGAMSLDFALHDLAGAILEQPVYQMLGSHDNKTVPCYDGAIYMDDLDPDHDPEGIEAVLRNCSHDYDLGYRAFKLKIGRGYRWMEERAGLQRDIEVTRAVREHYPDCQILVDANNGYTGEGFLEYLDSALDCGLFWIEEPFQETREDLSRLRDHLDQHSSRTLISDGELRPDIPFLLELATERLVDVLLMDVLSFGLTHWRSLMPELREIGVLASPHAWGTPLKSLYAAHIAAGLGNAAPVEGVPGTTVAVDDNGYRLEGGLLYLPDTPGFGMKPPSSKADS